ncbi:unnamed protein product [Brassica oleracea var. botrytis]
MKFSLNGEPYSRSTDEYWRFWDTGHKNVLERLC